MPPNSAKDTFQKDESVFFPKQKLSSANFDKFQVSNYPSDFCRKQTLNSGRKTDFSQLISFGTHSSATLTPATFTVFKDPSHARI